MDIPTELRRLADRADAALNDECRDRQLVAEGLIREIRRVAAKAAAVALAAAQRSDQRLMAAAVAAGATVTDQAAVLAFADRLRERTAAGYPPAGRREVWVPLPLPGGWVCGEPDPAGPDGVCGMPVESEPCTIHHPGAADQTPTGHRPSGPTDTDRTPTVRPSTHRPDTDPTASDT